MNVVIPNGAAVRNLLSACNVRAAVKRQFPAGAYLYREIQYTSSFTTLFFATIHSILIR